MSREKVAIDFQQFNVRLPETLVTALDVVLHEKRAANPGQMITRSDIVREALYAYVEQSKRDPSRRRK